MLYAAIKNTILFIAVALIPVVILDATAEKWLFSNISYTNSAAFDQKLSAMQHKGDDWDVLFVGSSEVRWGINPEVFDSEVHALRPDLNLKSYNIGLDGFSPGLMHPLLSVPDFVKDRKRPRIVFIGLNLAESVGVTRLEYAPGACGQLQKPILTSPFARDARVSKICDDPFSWSNWVEFVSRRVPLIRYRSQVRALLFQELPDPLSADITDRGFHPHPPDEDHVAKFWADQDRMREEEPERYAPLPSAYWNGAVAPGGFLDEFVQLGERRGWKIVYFHLPTNPNFFEAFEKEETVANNQNLMLEWVERSGEVFIDLGIRYDYDREMDFADFRHLSGRGADKFSAELARAFISSDELNKAVNIFSEQK